MVVQPDSSSSAIATVAAASSASGVSRAHTGYSACSQPNRVRSIAAGQRAGQRLVEMVVRVDQPRQHDVPARVERRGRAGGTPAGRHQLDDAAVLHDDAAGRVAPCTASGLRSQTPGLCVIATMA